MGFVLADDGFFAGGTRNGPAECQLESSVDLVKERFELERTDGCGSNEEEETVNLNS